MFPSVKRLQHFWHLFAKSRQRDYSLNVKWQTQLVLIIMPWFSYVCNVCQMLTVRNFTEPKMLHLHTSILVGEWPFALWKTSIEPNELFTQWKIKSPSLLASIKIPLCPTSFSSNLLLFLLLIESIFPRTCFDMGTLSVYFVKGSEICPNLTTCFCLCQSGITWVIHNIFHLYMSLTAIRGSL